MRLDVRAPEAVIEDACQVAWCRLLDHSTGSIARPCIAWLARTAVHEALKLLRRDRRELSLDAALEDGERPSFAIAPATPRRDARAPGAAPGGAPRYPSASSACCGSTRSASATPRSRRTGCTRGRSTASYRGRSRAPGPRRSRRRGPRPHRRRVDGALRRPAGGEDALPRLAALAPALLGLAQLARLRRGASSPRACPRRRSERACAGLSARVPARVAPDEQRDPAEHTMAPTAMNTAELPLNALPLPAVAVVAIVGAAVWSRSRCSAR